MPDEYLPPNATLFIQDLVEGTTKDVLEEVFGRSVLSLASALVLARSLLTRNLVWSCRYPNLVSVRMIPAKKDIAFVDFGDEASSTLAKEALNGYKLGEGEEAASMKVSPLSFLSPALSLGVAAGVTGGGARRRGRDHAV